jgi:hypothetical protein
MKSVYSAVRTGSLNTAVCASSVNGIKFKAIKTACSDQHNKHQNTMQIPLNEEMASVFMCCEQINPPYYIRISASISFTTS